MGVTESLRQKYAEAGEVWCFNIVVGQNETIGQKINEVINRNPDFKDLVWLRLDSHIVFAGEKQAYDADSLAMSLLATGRYYSVYGRTTVRIPIQTE